MAQCQGPRAQTARLYFGLHLHLAQARPQDSVTEGADINLGGHEKFIYVNSRGARGHMKFIPVWIK